MKIHPEIKRLLSSHVEIETEWNLKNIRLCRQQSVFPVEIETEWNLKKDSGQMNLDLDQGRDRNRVEFKEERDPDPGRDLDRRDRNRVEFKEADGRHVNGR